MATRERVTVRLEADDQLSGALRTAATNLGNLAPKVAANQSAFSKMQAAIVTANQALELAGKFARAASRAFLGVVETADRFRRMQILLETLSGSTEKANKSMAFLVDLAKKTPQTLATLTDSFIKMKAGGVEDTERAVKALSSAVAAFGGSDEQLKRASIAIQQMAGKGVISMEELRQQLGEAVPSSIRIMAREMNLTMGALVKRISTGSLEAQEGLSALFRGFEKDFDGAALRMMDTWAGATSNFDDSWAQFMKALGETGLLDAAISGIQGLTGAVASLTEVVNDFNTNSGPELRAEIKSLTDDLNRLRGDAASGTAGVQRRMNELLDALAPLQRELRALDRVTDAAAATMTDRFMRDFLITVLPILDSFQRKLGETGNTASNTAEDFGGLAFATNAVKDAAENLDPIMRQLVDDFGGVEGQAEDLRKVILQMVQPVKDVTSEFSGWKQPLEDAAVEMERIRDAAIELVDATENPPVPSDPTGAGGAAVAGAAAGGGIVGGVVGGIAGGEDPAVALITSFFQLAAQNEKVREAVAELDAAIIQVLTPTIELLVPVIRAMTAQVELLIPIAEEQARLQEELGDEIETLKVPLEDLENELRVVGDRIVKLFEVLEKPLKKVGDNLQKLETKIGELKTSVENLGGFVIGLTLQIAELLRKGGGSILGRFHAGGELTQQNLLGFPGAASDEGLFVGQVGERVLSRAEVAQAPVGGPITINAGGITQPEKLITVLDEQRALGRI